MLAAVDVHYRESRALAACVEFSRWDSQAVVRERLAGVEQVEPYLSGQFYRRELPCLLGVLARCETTPEVVIIDGFVWLGDDTRPGLGAHLYRALNRAVAVVGVAKRRRTEAGPYREVCRGKSANPLFVSSAGIQIDAAARGVASMHGPDRIPTLLKRVDRLSRGLE